MSCAEIADTLAAARLPFEGQIAFHLIRRAAFQGLVCYGPDRDGDTTFVRVADWLDVGQATMEPETAAQQLARRYVAAFGPAGPEDFASWTGLSMRDARRAFAAIQPGLVEAEMNENPLWLTTEQADQLEVSDNADDALQLLPAFDSYLLAYRDRQLSVPERHSKQVHPGGGIIRPTVMIGGIAAGIWAARRKRGRLEVEVKMFGKTSKRILSRIRDRVDDLARYHAMQAELKLSPLGET